MWGGSTCKDSVCLVSHTCKFERQQLLIFSKILAVYGTRNSVTVSTEVMKFNVHGNLPMLKLRGFKFEVRHPRCVLNKSNYNVYVYIVRHN